jgi:uncharacterized membrane protein
MAKRWLQWIPGGILGFTWMVVIRNYRSLPPEIPIHFNFRGIPDNWAPKAGIWILPLLATGIYWLFTLLQKYAHKLPQPAKPGASGADVALMKSFFGQLRLATALAFMIGILYTVKAARNGMGAEAAWPLWIIIILITLPTIVFLFRTLRAGKQGTKGDR